VGFVLDRLGMSSTSLPLLELMAFVGLQRFLPSIDQRRNSHSYTLWTVPLLPSAAAAVASGHAAPRGSLRFAFPLLFRTKYLKSFLPAQPSGGA
jgi:CRISPR-associated protein Csb3